MLRFTLLLSVLLSVSTFARAESAQAIFAGGCFWCMESAYQEYEGVTEVVSGFTGGDLQNPTYKGRHEGHYEAVQVTYDPAVVSYGQLLAFFWRNVDPFDGGGQFCDRGDSYRSALFFNGEQERKLAEASQVAVASQFPEDTIATELLPTSTFWPVEEGHQDYYLKNPLRYKYYRWNCGRDQRLEALWGSPGH
ncbi:MAG: peptide-methionine (S)-S-oxide reductase MsrA [Halioglobus sp.]